LEPFGITVVDLKTNATKSNGMTADTNKPRLFVPKGSLYEPEKEAIETWMNYDKLAHDAMDTQEYGEVVVRNLLKKPAPLMWIGGFQTWLMRFALLLPFGTLDGMVKKMTGLDTVVARSGK
jgi:hypothetical protein